LDVLGVSASEDAFELALGLGSRVFPMVWCCCECCASLMFRRDFFFLLIILAAPESGVQSVGKCQDSTLSEVGNAAWCRESWVVMQRDCSDKKTELENKT
jgi:hypothetical protein